ncbi:MAG: 16S rRNA (cytosine(1402)-N(4))-methyltransferase RsmH [Lentisphaeria bacterium]|nr:16S rRNA (cytosine(1402)-N(4))-methyltransferase RsmH [Lentisphaeria bacterium]
MSQSERPHISVMLEECLDCLKIRPGGKYIDGTLGAAGHTKAMLSRNPEIEVLGIDRDHEALAIAKENLSDFSDRVHLKRGNFADMDQLSHEINWSRVDGILLDLGVSSMQFDRDYRGFSYRFDGPLDMRMDKRQPVTAASLVNTEEPKELTRIFRKYGEEPKARRITEAIVAARSQKAIVTTSELADIIQEVCSRPGQTRRQSEARIFQALRIAVNSELTQLESILEKAVDLLNPGGRLAIISFHSLEDRMVKQHFLEEAKDCICPPDLPVCSCSKVARLKIVTRKPITASLEEKSVNSRSTSAKLRAAERL